jgi:BASS family bile acid:Na+ symporter
MGDRPKLLAAFSGFVQGRFLGLLLGSYAVAAFFPQLGLWLRGLSLGELTLFGERTKVTPPMLMLALLLANAGLGVRASQLGGARRGAALLGAGLLANLLLPLAFILGVSQAMRLWHNPDEVQNILVGLALVASMPIAGSSTAWSQNANGNLALSLGLVVGSTLLSPLTTPVALHAVGWMAEGDYSQDLHELAAGGAGAFLGACVVLPSLLGLALRGALGEARATAAKPYLKLLNALNLLLLNYANAAVSLPEAVSNPDPDFVAVTLGLVLALCGLAFGAGACLARLLRADAGQRTALMFGLGMNNNGTGLVLASLALADHPRVMLPIILYNLIQHFVAAGVDRFLTRRPRAPGAPRASSS